MSQLSPKRQAAEMAWVRAQRAAAEQLTEISDYARATMFALEVFAERGDARAKAEIAKRRGY